MIAPPAASCGLRRFRRRCEGSRACTRFETILCALTAAPTHKSAQATQLVVVDPSSAGRVAWQHTFPQTEGSVISWGSFAPILVARDEAIVLWQFAPDRSNPDGPAAHAVRRLKLVRRTRRGAARRV
jgi:hypothetical protein